MDGRIANLRSNVTKHPCNANDPSDGECIDSGIFIDGFNAAAGIGMAYLGGEWCLRVHKRLTGPQK